MIGYDNRLIDAMLSGVLAALDGASNPAKVAIYPAPRPADGVPTAAPLVTVPLARPAGTVATGKLTLAPSADGLVLVEGDPAWCRICDGNDRLLLVADVAPQSAPGNAEIILNAERLYAGGAVRIVSGEIAPHG
ncbi:hypothetical protein [Chitiniphilus eburneus]|uniref:hypothetical protein n=1 Tax=Chitiniphilus eburneus TaxID=2571148 RepID=UPI0035D0B4D1